MQWNVGCVKKALLSVMLRDQNMFLATISTRISAAAHHCVSFSCRVTEVWMENAETCNNVKNKHEEWL